MPWYQTAVRAFRTLFLTRYPARLFDHLRRTASITLQPREFDAHSHNPVATATKAGVITAVLLAAITLRSRR
jgi:hypothetical protein